MESYTIKNLTFSYPQKGKKVFDNLSFSIRQGQFITLAAPPAAGKPPCCDSLKPCLHPMGTEGERFCLRNTIIGD